MIPDGFVLLLSNHQIGQRLEEIGADLRHQLGNHEVTFVGILDGALFVMTDLIRAYQLDAKVDFLRVTSYRGGTESGELTMLSGLTWNVKEHDVVLVDDILDSGQTLAFCRQHLMAMGAASITSVVLLTKERHRDFQLENPVVGFRIPDRFVIGYGLDFEGRFRHLPDIYIKDKEGAE
ncbi:MAG: phosphoribosyltransferase family protein [Candidatus Lernaella stagnicola]|nr:phosphoribosyltransferase family protein [Candidatus Lernaella stagnicola]